MTKSNMMTVAVVALFAAAFAMLPEAALAAGTGTSTGESTLQSIGEVVKGNIGTLVGLFIALLGLWQWLMDQSTWGVVMMIGGIAITAFPGLFTAGQKTFSNLFGNAGASNDQGVDFDNGS